MDLARLRAAPAAVVQRITRTPEAGPESHSIEDVVAEARLHRPSLNVGLIERAHEVAAAAHEGQLRASGEPYITHPLQVAFYLAELQMDAETLAAALLHDVPEDTDMALVDIEKRFGREVGRLVDGVTKLSKFGSARSMEEVQAENIRKMFLAMAEDVRVVIIKLADRLHNMRTLGFLPADKQVRIARQTMEIYDLHAIRLIVDEVKATYAALGVVHSLWRPIPGQFDDYIAMPKANLYQSLHTAVIGPDARPLEVQIRTRSMHEVAEAGIAAHWRYKEGSRGDRRYDEKLAWVRQLIEWQREVADATEFVEGLKLDLFQDQVFVFTPKGDVKDLPAGAGPLDFAYRIHTDVGHRTIGAKVNNRLMPLDYRLRNGDIVEIITTKAAHGPSRD